MCVHLQCLKRNVLMAFAFRYISLTSKYLLAFCDARLFVSVYFLLLNAQ